MLARTTRSISSIQRGLTDVGSLILRVAFGGMLLAGHGWGKLMSYSESASSFPDPLGVGNNVSMMGAIFSEVICSALIIVGLATRLACIPLVFTFLTAAFIVHGSDPTFLPGERTKEPALLYLFAFTSLLFIGPGRASLDHVIAGRSLPRT